MSADDQFGDENEDIDAYIIAALPEKLRERTCPAGLPHTGDDPASDHGHTDCWFMQLAATEIERLRADHDRLTNENQALRAAIDIEDGVTWSVSLSVLRELMIRYPSWGNDLTICEALLRRIEYAANAGAAAADRGDTDKEPTDD